MGAVPNRCAKAGSEPSRWGCRRRDQQLPGGVDPDPGPCQQGGRGRGDQGLELAVELVELAWSCCQRRARVHSVVLVAAVVLVRGPGRRAAQAPTRALVLRPSSGWESAWGALYSIPWSCSAAATRALRAPRRATRALGSSRLGRRGSWGWWRPPRPGWPGRRSDRTCPGAGGCCGRGGRPRPLGGRRRGRSRPGRPHRCRCLPRPCAPPSRTVQPN